MGYQINGAKGLRNSVGFVFHPATGVMYATDNGRDMLGDDLPPDEINILDLLPPAVNALSR